MSFKIIALDPKTQFIHAIYDKRGMLNGEFYSDDLQKIGRVAPNLYFVGGKYFDLFEDCLKSLLEISDQPVSAIIKRAKLFDRRITPTAENPTATHDEATLFGLFDDGKMFIWNANPDGTDNGAFPISSPYIKMGGGKKGTQEAAASVFFKNLEDFQQLPVAMIETLLYAASIDKVISPAYDFVQVDVKNKVSGEFANIKTLARL